MIDDRTARGLPLPHVANRAREDAARIREAIELISAALDAAATMAYVDTALADLVASSPAALDTLAELSAALGNDADFATTVTNAISTKQPLHATLTALAGLALSADTLPYATGPDALGLTTLTAFARSLLGGADAAAVRTLLAAASPGVAQTWTAAQAGAYVTVAEADPVEVNLVAGNRHILTLTASRTMGAPAGVVAGRGGLIKIVQGGAGGYALAWSSAWHWEGGNPPSLSTAAGAVDFVGYEVDDAGILTGWLGVKGRA